MDVSELAGIDHVPTSWFDVVQALVAPGGTLLSSRGVPDWDLGRGLAAF